MNVALLHHSVPPVVGGVESVIAQHARLMAGAGHVVRLVAARGEGLSAGVPLQRLPLVDSRHARVLANKSELDAGRVPADFDALRREIAEGLAGALAGVDVLIAHNVCSLHKNLALTAALHGLHQAGALPRLILWHHDLAWTAAHYRAELHPGYPWDLLRTDWPGARHVVVSEPRRRELAGLLKIPVEKIAVVPNGAETAHLYRLEAQTRALVQVMRLDDAEPRLLLPVRLTPRKNIELALRTLAALRAWNPPQHPLARAALVVTGPEGAHNPANRAYRERLLVLRDELGLAGAAHFVAEYTDAFLPDAVVADFYRLADALILPSREEGFGIPLVEAALMRLPIFCSAIPPLQDLGGDDVTYFSPEAAPETVARLIADRLGADPVYRLATRARATYTWDRIYPAHIEPLLNEG